VTHLYAITPPLLLLLLLLPPPPLSTLFPYTTLFRSPSSVATTFDGYPMTQNGQPGRALSVGLWSSFFGTIISGLILIFAAPMLRSEEHTSELQSRFDLVCRLLLEKKNELIEQNVQYN